nr:MAG TPA: hypothetical protein [Caudoviricetes sp.]
MTHIYIFNSVLGYKLSLLIFLCVFNFKISP